MMISAASRRRPSGLVLVSGVAAEARVASVIEALVAAAAIETRDFLLVSWLLSVAARF